MRTLHDVPESERIAFAQIINENKNLSWTANAYAQVDMEHLERQQMTTLAQTAANWPPSDAVLDDAQRYLAGGPESMTAADLEDEFDWSNF